MQRYGAHLESVAGRRLRESAVAERWLTERYEPTIAAIPADLAVKLEPAELYHQVLEHRWYLSEVAGFDVGLGETIASYAAGVLAGRGTSS